uniref:Uncharacterized protein n=1 Tax=Avena sativa TaxID=4498 RepID=A0ACD5XES3_AVESA
MRGGAPMRCTHHLPAASLQTPQTLSVPASPNLPLYIAVHDTPHTAQSAHTLVGKQQADRPVSLSGFQCVNCSPRPQMARVVSASSACALLVLLVACSAALAATAARDVPSGSRQPWGGDRGRKVGARTEVRDVEGDREVQELGRYSVEEHNRRQREEDDREGGVGPLEFRRVVAAQRQVVSGIKYYLRVAAADDRVFDAVVVVKPWLQSRALLRFAPADAE